MVIEIKRVTPWSRALNSARWTAGLEELDREPSENFKTNILMPQHSPIRMVEYDIKIKGIPYCNAVHFVRHHIGIEKFQCSLRDDRNNEIDDRKALPQNYPVNLWLACNAEALINISRRRLCAMASTETRNIWRGIKKVMELVDPVLPRFMVKECIYRGGMCPEDPNKSCRYVLTESFKRDLEAYRDGFLHI